MVFTYLLGKYAPRYVPRIIFSLKGLFIDSTIYIGGPRNHLQFRNTVTLSVGDGFVEPQCKIGERESEREGERERGRKRERERNSSLK